MSPVDLREAGRLLQVLATALDEEARRAPVARDGCRRVAGRARRLAHGLHEAAGAPPAAHGATCRPPLDAVDFTAAAPTRFEGRA